MRRIVRRAGPWLRVVLGAAILAVLVWRLGTEAFLDGLRVVDPASVLAALGIGLVTTVLSAWRWCLVTRRLGLALPMGTAVADYYRAIFLNSALPGGVLGDVHRAIQHGHQAGDVGRGVRAVILERTAGQAVVLLAGVTALLTQPFLLTGVFQAMATTGSEAVALIVLGAGLVALSWICGPGTVRWRRTLDALRTDVRLGLFSRESWPGVVTLSAAVLAGHLALFVVAARTAGVSGPVSQVLPLLVLALVAMGLPVNVAGWGPREGVAALAFGAAGLGAAQGLTVAVVYGVLTFLGSLPGAGVLVRRSLIRARAAGQQVELEERVIAQADPADRSA